jgi:cullin 3
VTFSAEKTWATLANNIREIHNRDASNLSFEENYRFAYNMVLHKEGKMLYDGVNKLVAENLDKLAKDEIIPTFPAGGSNDPMHQSQEGDLLLKALRSTWDDHTGNMTKLGQLLKYMVTSHYISLNAANSPDAGSSAHENGQRPRDMGSGTHPLS